MTRVYSLHLPSKYDPSNSVATPLVLDYHGWSGTAHDQMTSMPWRDVADVDSSPFIYVAMEGMNDVVEGGWWGSWNVSSTEGFTDIIYYSQRVIFSRSTRLDL